MSQLPFSSSASTAIPYLRMCVCVIFIPDCIHYDICWTVSRNIISLCYPVLIYLYLCAFRLLLSCHSSSTKGIKWFSLGTQWLWQHVSDRTMDGFAYDWPQQARINVCVSDLLSWINSLGQFSSSLNYMHMCYD